MIRLAKYLKPYRAMILLAIVLLFAQANFDLALPDYLSRIVNTGIQQGGVENAVPVAIRQSEMDKLVLFMSATMKAAVLGAATPWWIRIRPTMTARFKTIPFWQKNRSMS